jgi:hypothetical protein
VQATEAERDLFAYWHMMKLIDEQQLIEDAD